MPKRIFAVLYVSVMGLTRCYKTIVFFYIYLCRNGFIVCILIRGNVYQMVVWLGDSLYLSFRHKNRLNRHNVLDGDLPGVGTVVHNIAHTFARSRQNCFDVFVAHFNDYCLRVNFL